MKRGMNRFLLLCLTFVFLIGVVSAWSVSITAPINDSYFGSKPSQFSWTYSGIDLNNLSSNLEYNVNGNINYGSTINSIQAIGAPQVIQGGNSIILSVTNISGQTENTTLDFWVDSINPLITLLNPLGNIGYTNTNVLNLIVQLTETNKGGYHPSGSIDSSNRYIWRQFVYPSGGTETNSFILNSSNVSSASLIPSTLEEGNYTFTIKSRDKYPNGNTIREVTETGVIIRDTLPPITSISSPLNGLFYAGIVSIISSAIDDISVTTDVSGVNNIDIQITDGVYLDSTSCIASSCNYDWNSILTTDGPYNIIATSFDRAGNPSGPTTITINIDNTAPTIIDDYVLDGIWTNVAPQLVTLTPDDGTGSGINNVKYCEGVGCAPNIDLISPYQLNYNTEQDTIVRYQTWDNVGNPSLIGEYNVKIDLTAPIVDAGSDVITRIQITQDATVNASISGVASYLWTQIAGPGIITFGTPTTEDTTISADADVIYTLRLTATDNAGNSAFDEISFTWDTTAPITTDNAPIGWQNSDVTVTLFPTDALSGVANTLYCIDQTDTCSPSTPGTNILVSTEGINFVRYYSTDNAGNIESTKSAQVWIDKSAPIVDAGSDVITNSLITQNAIVDASISGVASYLWTGPIEIIFVDNSVEDAQISATTDGVYIIQLTVTDNAGNSNSDTIQFTWDTTAPIVTINSLLTNDPTPELTGTIDDIAATIQITVDGNIYAGTNNEDGTWTLTDNIISPDLTEGIYDVSIDATDLAGNIGNDLTIDELEIDTTIPSITNFQAVPSVSISQNNPTTITAVDVSDTNLDFTGLMFVDFNNLVTSSDQILFIANMNDAPVSGPYGPINWNTDYFKITDGTINEPVSVFVTNFAPTEYIITGYFQEDPAIPTPLEDCMLGFDMTTNELTLTSYCAGTRIDGVSKFTISSLKFTNGIFSPPSEINGSTFTLYTIGNPLNPKLELTPSPSGDYTLILRAEDSAGNDAGEMLTISVDNTAPTITDYLIGVQGLTPTTNNVVYISPQNSLSLQDGLNLSITADEIVDWTIRIQNPDGSLATSSQWTTSNSINTKKPVSCEFWNGTANQCSNIGYLSEGTYTINVTLIDNANNLFTDFSKSIIVDNTLPTLSSISATSITPSSASIIWTTDENANSSVYYWTTVPASLIGSATYEIAHSIPLSSLSASTLYYYNVSSCDAAGNCATSTQYNFTTSAQDDGGNGGGGGGGGGGGSYSSIKYYECSEWTDWPACSNNLQTRTCLKKITTTSQKGVIESKFNETETRACTSPALIPLAGSVVEETNEVSGKPTEEATPGFIGRITGGITGAVTGLTKSKGGKISLIVIAVLALAWLLLAYKRKINRQKQERRIRIIHKGGLGKK